MKNIFRASLLYFLMFASPALWANSLTLRVPLIAEQPTAAAYYHELLTQAFADIGYRLDLEIIHLPQARAQVFLDQNKLDVLWMLQSEERDAAYTSVPVGLTHSLISNRILLIRPEDQSKFDDVKSLSDLRNLNLVAGLGRDWFDVNVWQANDLSFEEQEGSWQSIFPMLAANRVYDYFPRGMNEVVAEADAHPDLAIENNLVLAYQRDFQLYLSEEAAQHQELLTRALAQARDSGLIERLVQEHWAEEIQQLDFKNRRVLNMKNP